MSGGNVKLLLKDDRIAWTRVAAEGGSALKLYLMSAIIFLGIILLN